MESHKLSLFTAILLNINIMIGSGILIGPGLMAAVAGNASFLAWPLVALLFLPLVLSIVQLSGMCPGSGGFYAYAKLGLNQQAGYLSGLLYVIGYTFAAAAEVMAIRNILLVSAGNYWIFENYLAFNAFFIIICTLFNLMSLKWLSSVLNSITISKLIPLVTLILLLPFFFTTNFTITAPEISALPFALPLAIFGYFGFEYCCSISHLISNSERNAPRAILFGFLITAFVYTLFHFGLLMLMGPAQLAQYNGTAFAQFLNIPIPYLKELLMLLIPAASVLTLFAGANGMINSNATMLHSMAQEDLFKGGEVLIPVTNVGRPWRTIVLQSILIFIISSFVPTVLGIHAASKEALNLIFGLCNVGVFLSFILPFLSLVVFHHRTNKSLQRRIMPLLALLVTSILALYSWYCLGTTVYERVTYFIPLIMAIATGLLVERR